MRYNGVDLARNSGLSADRRPSGAFLITPAQAALLEARYKPVAPVGEWLSTTVDRARWNRYLARLTTTRPAAGSEAWLAVQHRLLQLAAFDTGALDGLYPANPELTSRIANPRTEEGRPVGMVSPGLAAFVEHQLAGYRLVIDAAAQDRAIDGTFIRRLHETMVGAQETYLALTPDGEKLLPLPRGVYKDHTNFYSTPSGTIGAYAPAGRVPEEVQRLVIQLSSAQFSGAHPAVQAAYAHNALARIHPFADANGRVGRALASAFFFQAAGVPLLVLADQWPRYLQALMHADVEDQQGLVDFMFARGIDAIDLATNLMASSARWPRPPAISQATPSARASVVEAAAARLVFDALWIELRERLVSPPAGVRLAVSAVQRSGLDIADKSLGAVSDPESGNSAVVVSLSADDPRPVRVERCFAAVVSGDPANLLPVGIWEQSTRAHFELALADVDPLFSDMARIRLRAWLSARIGEAYREFERLLSVRG